MIWAGDDHYSYQWKPDADIWFRYIDLTDGVAFTLDMAQVALDGYLRQEVASLGFPS